MESLQSIGKNIGFQKSLEMTKKEVKVKILEIQKTDPAASFNPVILATLVKYGDSKEKDDKEKLLELLQQIANYHFLVYHISHRNRHGDNQVRSIAYRIHHEKDVDGSIKEIKNHIKKRFHDDNLATFKLRIRQEFAKGEGFYSWRGIQYFLYKYDVSLSEKRGDIDPKLSYEEKMLTKKDIDHIYPQKPAQKSEWESFEDYENTDEKYRIQDAEGLLTNLGHLTHSLGNLLLLSEKINKKRSNRSYKKTREDGLYYLQTMSSQTVHETYTEWTPDTIKHRGEEMLAFLLQHIRKLQGQLDIDLVKEISDTEKEELLGLEFLSKQST